MEETTEKIREFTAGGISRAELSGRCAGLWTGGKSREILGDELSVPLKKLEEKGGIPLPEARGLGL